MIDGIRYPIHFSAPSAPPSGEIFELVDRGNLRAGHGACGARPAPIAPVPHHWRSPVSSMHRPPVLILKLLILGSALSLMGNHSILGTAGPAFVIHPSDVSTHSGSTITTIVGVDSSGPATLAWKLVLPSGRELQPSSSAKILRHDRTLASLTFGPISDADSGDYYVLVSDTLGTTKSNPAKLKITAALPPKPDRPDPSIAQSLHHPKTPTPAHQAATEQEVTASDLDTFQEMSSGRIISITKQLCREYFSKQKQIIGAELESSIEIGTPETIEGWPGRYRMKGRAILRHYRNDPVYARREEQIRNDRNLSAKQINRIIESESLVNTEIVNFEAIVMNLDSQPAVDITVR